MAKYREGVWQEAISFLETAAKEEAPVNCRPSAYAYLALAALKQGQTVVAEQYLRKAEELQASVEKQGLSGWHDRLFAELALREAREMMDGGQ